MLQRLHIIKEWFKYVIFFCLNFFYFFSSKKPSVLIISYEMFRILTKSNEDEPLKKTCNKVNIQKKIKRIKYFEKLQVEFRKYLQSPGFFLTIIILF